MKLFFKGTKSILKVLNRYVVLGLSLYQFASLVFYRLLKRHCELQLQCSDYGGILMSLTQSEEVLKSGEFLNMLLLNRALSLHLLVHVFKVLLILKIGFLKQLLQLIINLLKSLIKFIHSVLNGHFAQYRSFSSALCLSGFF